MSPLTFAHLREVNVARQGPGGWNLLPGQWTRDEWLVATGGELGEAMNVLKKLNRARDGIIGNDQPASLLRDMLGDETADTAIYLDLYAASEDLVLFAPATIVSDLVERTEIAAFLGNPPSRHMGAALRAIGKASAHIDQAHWWRDRGDERNWHDNRADAADALESALLSLAATLRHFGLDLGASIVRKFNATSDKHGMPHRLVPS